MLLAVDIGNSSISLGLFDLTDTTPRPTPCLTAKLASATVRTADEYAILIRSLLTEKGYNGRLSAGVIGSVVPQLTHTLELALQKLTGDASFPILHIEGGVRTGISLRVEDPASLGADIVTNAAAAAELYGTPVVFLDLGTATVCGAVNSRRELVGVSIAPGVTTALEGLRASAARIPYLELKTPDTVLNRNTTTAICSGLLLGTACMIDGMVERIREELKLSEEAPLSIVATGGLAELVIPACRHSIRYEPDLTILGLCLVYKATVERRAKKNRSVDSPQG